MLLRKYASREAERQRLIAELMMQGFTESRDGQALSCLSLSDLETEYVNEGIISERYK
ncbi:hypothetical protein [Salipaludibacillus sp. CF4.18]|uniref:hypothetical protein n=1 Tax=Salipaludibacillus sp. CF4.18 TaxID=3373081 RepID=UPI003EE707AE